MALPEGLQLLPQFVALCLDWFAPPAFVSQLVLERGLSLLG